MNIIDNKLNKIRYNDMSDHEKIQKITNLLIHHDFENIKIKHYKNIFVVSFSRGTNLYTKKFDKQPDCSSYDCCDYFLIRKFF